MYDYRPGNQRFSGVRSGIRVVEDIRGHQQDYCYSLVNTSDGGFLIGGWTDWHLQNSSYAWSIDNFFLLKTDKNGNQEWYRTYGDNQSFLGGYVCEAPGGGYVLAGSLGQYSIGSRILIKVDASGQVLWKKYHLTWFDGRVKSLEAAPDGYILAGTSNRSVFLMRFGPDGNLIRDRSYDEPDLDVGRALSTRDGGFVIAGGPSFDKTGKMFLMKADAAGNMTWLKYYGSGYTGGDLHHRGPGRRLRDRRPQQHRKRETLQAVRGSSVYVVRTDQDGNVLWKNV